MGEALDQLAGRVQSGDLSLGEALPRRDALLGAVLATIDARLDVAQAHLDGWARIGRLPGDAP
jgi:hypothetical protein